MPDGVDHAARSPEEAGIPVSVRESTIAILTEWQAPDPAQDSLRHAVLAFVHGRADACIRECEPGHITASTLVLDDDGSQVLLTLHPRLGRWVQLGGHCEDDDGDILAAALREATEESGVAGLRIHPALVAIHVHPVTCSLGFRPATSTCNSWHARRPARRSPSATSPTTCGGGPPTRCRRVPTTPWPTLSTGRRASNSDTVEPKKRAITPHSAA